ncbi:MAG TPA: ATP-binding protein [Candidatus Binataceae bacterium]
MEPQYSVAAEHLGACKHTLLARWRELVRADTRLPERRLTFTDPELEDHLPALLESIVRALRGDEIPEAMIRQPGARHGSTRRAQGYSINQLVWEFAIFRKLLSEALEQLAAELRADLLFAVREKTMELSDQSEMGSVEQYVQEAQQERDSAREELSKANDQRARFLSVLSHELHNPLAAVRTALHIVQGERSSDSERQRALEIIDRQTTYQTRLIDDLLDMNRISQGRIELRREPVDLRRTVTNVIDTYTRAIESKSISFRFDYPDREVLVFADPVRIEQVIANLLMNSLKFTRAGGSIEIRVSQEDVGAIVSVRDTGVGIEPSSLDRIFELFSAGWPGKSESGLGIGLWLARQLVDLHGGTIEAHSKGAGKGTEVIVRLACMARPRAENPARSVLLVEDDPDQRELMVMALSEIDAEVVGAKDGSEAVALAGSRHFDVCILDLNLPDITGYDLVGRLLELQGEPRPVMIALTGYGRPEDAARVESAGFNYHVVKPADIKELQRIIGEARGEE